MNTIQNTQTPSPTTPTPDAPSSVRSWLKHPVTVAIGAAGAVIVLIAGVVVIADEIAEEIWPERYYSSDSSLGASTVVPQADPGAPGTDTSATVSPQPVPAPAPTTVDSSEATPSGTIADQVRAILDAAVTAAGGVGATEIDVSDAVAYVDVLMAAGREVDVYVGPSNAVRVDTSSSTVATGDPAIERDRLADVIAIATGALADDGATLLSVSTNAAASERYELEWRTSGGGTVWVELTADLAVADVDGG